MKGEKRADSEGALKGESYDEGIEKLKGYLTKPR